MRRALLLLLTRLLELLLLLLTGLLELLLLLLTGLLELLLLLLLWHHSPDLASRLLLSHRGSLALRKRARSWLLLLLRLSHHGGLLLGEQAVHGCRFLLLLMLWHHASLLHLGLGLLQRGRIHVVATTGNAQINVAAALPDSAAQGSGSRSGRSSASSIGVGRRLLLLLLLSRNVDL